MSIIAGLWSEYCGEFFIQLAAMKEGIVPVRNLAGRAGFLRRDGSIIGEVNYEDVGDFDRYCCVVKQNGYFAIMDQGGKLITEFVFDEVKLLDKGAVAARRGERWCFINVAERIVTPLFFDEVECFRENYTFVIVEDAYGVVGLNGEYVVNPEYDFIAYFAGHFLVNKGKLFGVCFPTGELALPVEYTEQEACNWIRTRE